MTVRHVSSESSKGRLTPMEVVSAAVNVLNIIVGVIMAVEVIIRFASFLRSWKPAQKRKMGFYRKMKGQP